MDEVGEAHGRLLSERKRNFEREHLEKLVKEEDLQYQANEGV